MRRKRWNIVSKCSKLAQKSTRLSRIEWERLSTENCGSYWNLLYAQNRNRPKELDSKILRDFEIKAYRKPKLELMHTPKKKKKKKKEKRKEKKICRLVDFAVLTDHRMKIKETEKINRYLELARELKSVEHEGDGDSNYSWCAWNGSQGVRKGPGEYEIRGRIETIHNNTFFSTHEETCSHSDSSEGPLTKDAGERYS